MPRKPPVPGMPKTRPQVPNKRPPQPKPGGAGGGFRPYGNIHISPRPTVNINIRPGASSGKPGKPGKPEGSGKPNNKPKPGAVGAGGGFEDGQGAGGGFDPQPPAKPEQQAMKKKKDQKSAGDDMACRMEENIRKRKKKQA